MYKNYITKECILGRNSPASGVIVWSGYEGGRTKIWTGGEVPPEMLHDGSGSATIQWVPMVQRKIWCFWTVCKPFAELSLNHSLWLPLLWPSVTTVSMSWKFWTLSTGMPLTANTTYLYQKGIDIHIEEKNIHWFVKKSKGFEEVVSQELCNAEKVSNSWTNIVSRPRLSQWAEEGEKDMGKMSVIMSVAWQSLIYLAKEAIVLCLEPSIAWFGSLILKVVTVPTPSFHFKI